MKIICIGRNYIDHAKELDNPIPEQPIYFMKPDCALLINNKPFYLPDFSNDVQHEVELVVKINRLGKHIEKQFAHRYYNEIGLGVDLTARDVQKKCMAEGLPWEIAKSFDSSAPLGKFKNINDFAKQDNIGFELLINEKIVQKGQSKDMLFSIDDIISYVSKFITLKIGDLIYTGTPAGVGPVKVGDTLIGKIEGEEMFNFEVK
jgi:2-keto-4-pentenoate hydratase/2-oxohepta-3-ene-1,7-dioic acid hydratase in catechol pathway